MKNSILTLDHVSLSLPDNTDSGKKHIWNFHASKKEILHDISFTVEKNEIIGLVGESGCGKSTLAHTILGFHKEYTGEICFENTETTAAQMVFQDPYGSLNPKKTVAFILAEPLKMSGGYTKLQIEEKCITMLNKVGLDETYLGRYPHELSGGQRQRVCIAAALMQNPPFLIADEPVSALDVTIQAQVMELLFSLHKEMGLSILFISHDLRLIYQICDRVFIMKSGQIIERGSVDEVFENPKEEYTKKLIKDANLY